MEMFLRKREPEDLLEVFCQPYLYGRCTVFAEYGRINRLIGATVFIYSISSSNACLECLKPPVNAEPGRFSCPVRCSTCAENFLFLLLLQDVLRVAHCCPADIQLIEEVLIMQITIGGTVVTKNNRVLLTRIEQNG